MAASTTTASTAQFSDKTSSTSTSTTTSANGNILLMNNNNFNKDLKGEIQSAIAQSVELRALHAAALQPRKLNSDYHPSLSPVYVSQPAQSRQEDYPVFTPSYNEEPLPASIAFQSRPLSGNWDIICATDPPTHTSHLVLWDRQRGQHQTLAHSHACPSEDQTTFSGSFANRRIAAIRSPHADESEYIAKSSRRSSLADVNSFASCHKFKPAVNVSTEVDNNAKLDSNYYDTDTDTAVPFTDSNLSCQSQPRNRGMSLTWLFPMFKKKKQQNKCAIKKPQPASLTGSEQAMVSADRLKKKLVVACESRDAALTEVSEMRASLHELTKKLEQVESYCQELRRALQPADQVKDIIVSNQLQSIHKHGGSNTDTGMPVSEDVLIEGFLQIVSESRSSVKSFCKTLLTQIQDSEDDTLVDSINLLLQPYNQSVPSKHSKLLLYHLEAIINQALFQDFENCSFQKNGSPKLLDPLQQRISQFASYMALQDLSWNDVLSKGTKHYSPEFSKFCDQKMSSIISLLNWTSPWPEQLLQNFFTAAKNIWLLHLLAFSFSPSLVILRVEEHRSFDPLYMDDMLLNRTKARGPSRVKAMVMPGFYVKEKVIRCKVICKYKPSSYD